MADKQRIGEILPTEVIEPEWIETKKLFDTLYESMLQIKEKFPNEVQENPRALAIGIFRAVNDLEAFADSHYVVAKSAGVKFPKPQFETYENEPANISKARETARNMLIEKFETDLEGNDIDEFKIATKHLENYLRLKGLEYITKEVKEIDSEELTHVKEKNDAGWIKLYLKKFDVWRSPYTKPGHRDYDGRRLDVEYFTAENLSNAYWKVAKDINPNDDPEIDKGISRAWDDLWQRADIGIIWQELVNQPPDSNSLKLLNTWLNDNKDLSEDKKDLTKEAIEARIKIREVLFKAFEKSMHEARKKYKIRYGSSEDVNDIQVSLARGVDLFIGDLTGEHH